MSGDDSSLSLRAPARETVFRPFPLASPSGALYIERMFFLRRCINQSTLSEAATAAAVWAARNGIAFDQVKTEAALFHKKRTLPR